MNDRPETNNPVALAATGFLHSLGSGAGQDRKTTHHDAPERTIGQMSDTLVVPQIDATTGHHGNGLDYAAPVAKP